MTLSERLYIANNVYVLYPRFKEILAAIDDCHHFSNLKDEPECLFLKGETGAGKTTILKSYARNYPRYQTPDGTIVPVLEVTIPSPATVKSVVTKLLWQLGDPAYDKGTISNQTIRLIGLMKDCGVSLVFLDEFQHFIDRDSAKVLKTVSDWLKDLILDTKVPVVLIGLPEAETVFQFNPQLSRRFANRHNLSPFSWEDSGREFRTFLHAVESQLPLIEESALAYEEMALRFYYASDGIVAYVMKLIRYGTHLALKYGQKKLDLNVLANAFEKYVKADKPYKKNPFIDSDFLNEVKDASLYAPSMTMVGATSQKIKLKKKTTRASDILHK
ncbi:TniB family NTP-binding protein [Fischerella thermalis]|uniref:Transposase n=1 Tax=Fischerella thermalis CCMEE 5318 TaxID=2019666 RepID=A0A2N6LNY1_9CYAN|nr:TniB family NTP-binding protein [Fischerella thermalis]PMB27369.1 transposase [Fischerella thermalis CCMEE 5318]